MRETFYLDDNDDIVDKEKATRIVIRELDENGSLLKETFGYTNSTWSNIDYNATTGEPSPEIKEILDNFTDKNGNHIFRK